MTYLKITAVILLIVFIVWSGFFISFINSTTTLVSESNQGFIAYLPAEAVAVVLMLVFAILVWLAFSFFRE